VALSARRALAAGAIASALGIAAAATAPVAGTAGSDRTRPTQLFAGILVLVGWGLFAWGIHRFGRGSLAPPPPSSAGDPA
jgi:hypothetical protein